MVLQQICCLLLLLIYAGTSRASVKQVGGKSSRIIKIKVVSGQNISSVKINNKYVHMVECKDRSSEAGLYLLVLNERSGQVMSRRFGNGLQTAGLRDLSEFLSRVQQGRIIILTTLHGVAQGLDLVSRKVLSQVSTHFDDLTPGSLYAVVAVQGGHTLAEAHRHTNTKNTTKCSKQEVWEENNWENANQHNLTITTSVKLLSEASCDFSTLEGGAARQEFCDKYEGYGRLCNCSHPAPLHHDYQPLRNGVQFQQPIAIIASDRGSYLYRVLEALLPNRGLNRSMVTIFITEQDGSYEVAQLANLLGIRIVVHEYTARKSAARIGGNLKFAIEKSFSLFPKSTQLLILEDDIIVSPDFISYFAQTSCLLEQDVTLYCVSAWNDLSYRHSSYDPTLLYRTSYFPGLGWLMSKNILMDELLPNWPSESELWEWDIWMREEEQRLGRECVVPDVSRSWHFAYSGTHVNSALQHDYFSDRSLNSLADAQLNNVDSLLFSNYRERMNLQPEGARVPDMNKYFTTCLDIFPETNNLTERNRTYILTFSMKHAFDTSGIQNLFTCLGVWDRDVRGGHCGTWALFINKNPVLLVGIPYSEYAHFYLQALGMSPLFDFTGYDLKRGRRPALDDLSPPQVVRFSTPDTDQLEIRRYDAK